MRYLLLVVVLLFLCCWQTRYTESASVIEDLKRQGYDVKVSHTDVGVYIVKYRMPKDKEKK